MTLDVKKSNSSNALSNRQYKKTGPKAVYFSTVVTVARFCQSSDNFFFYFVANWRSFFTKWNVLLERNTPSFHEKTSPAD
jgi:hypothetical protein